MSADKSNPGLDAFVRDGMRALREPRGEEVGKQLAEPCIHLPDYAGEICAGCGEEIDRYGNTENDFRFCSFPDCGCDDARLCMAGEASPLAGQYNVENMYSLRDPRPRMRFAGAYYAGEFDDAQGIDARSVETGGLDPKDESPVAESDAQNPSHIAAQGDDR